MSVHPIRVVFSRPNNGYTHDRAMAAEHLTVGAVYTVERADEEAWHTSYRLAEVPDVVFNSVLFEPYTNGDREEDTEAVVSRRDAEADFYNEA